MAIITKQNVIDFAPEVASINSQAWILILAYANRLSADGIGGGEDGPEVELARVLLAAHYATASKRGKSGASGPLTSKAVGQVRESFGLVALASSDAALGATIYGQQLLGLIGMSLAAGPRLV